MQSHLQRDKSVFPFPFNSNQIGHISKYKGQMNRGKCYDLGIKEHFLNKTLKSASHKKKKNYANL